MTLNLLIMINLLIIATDPTLSREWSQECYVNKLLALGPCELLWTLKPELLLSFTCHELFSPRPPEIIFKWFKNVRTILSSWVIQNTGQMWPTGGGLPTAALLESKPSLKGQLLTLGVSWRKEAWKPQGRVPVTLSTGGPRRPQSRHLTLERCLDT